MRAAHSTHQLPTFPVYCSSWISEDKVVLGGGGGASKTGVKNQLRLYSVGPQKLDLISDFEFEKGADAPMSIAFDENSHSLICGVNEDPGKIEKGVNAHCRVLTVKEDQFQSGDAQKVTRSNNVDDYQKVTAVSSALSMVAVGSTDNEIHLLNLPALSPAAQPIKLDGELFDATFGAVTLIAVSTTQITVYTVPSFAANTSPTAGKASSKGKAKGAIASSSLPTLEISKTLQKPKLPRLVEGSTVSYRAARYHPDDWTQLYAVLNTSPPRGTRGGKRGAYIVRWNTKNWEMTKVKKIAEAGITCMDISSHGKYVAYALSDCSIGILDTETLSPLLSILKAHEFPATTLKFNPTGSLLISASADNSVEVVTVPEKFGGSWNFLFLVIFSILAILLAILYQMYERP